MATPSPISPAGVSALRKRLGLRRCCRRARRQLIRARGNLTRGADAARHDGPPDRTDPARDPIAQQRFDALSRLIALLMGVAAFQLMLGWQVLLPSNIGWLNFADRAMHPRLDVLSRRALGCCHRAAVPSRHRAFELHRPRRWLPLFAMPLKLIAAWLPRPFQY